MDHERISGLIGRIYETALTAAGWEGVLDDIADLAGAEAAWMVVVAPRLGLNSVVAPRSDPGIIADYQKLWWTKDPTLASTFRAPVGLVTSLKDTGRDRFLGSEFYNDFWRQSGHAAERLAANLICEEGAIASLGVQPSRRNDSIESELAAVFRVLVPHVVRSVRIGCDLRRLELERALARAGARPGVLMVDQGCRLVVADDEARRILAENGAIGVEGGVVALAPADAAARLRGMVASCWRGADRPRGGDLLVAGDAGPPLRVGVVPFAEPARRLGPELVRYPRAAAMLLLTEPARERERSAAVLRRRFGLTPAEAAVALELARAEGRAAAAARLGVTLATVRTHMMHIFDKVGVTSQAGLVGAMARAGIDLDPLEEDGGAG